MAQFTREMGCTPADLIRWLPEALGDLYPHASLKLDGNILLSAQNPQLEMIGVSRPVRKIALLHIPVLDLTLSFSENWTLMECEKALKRFDLYTRRGGG
jgi:hypothetical protein